jgi:protein-histidine pros-kinase
MLSFKALPISSKLKRMNIVVSASVLFLACASFIGYDVITFKNAIAVRVHTNAEIVGINVTPTLLFQDRGAAAETLSALRAAPNIISAAIYTSEGRIFAKYVRGFGSHLAALPERLDIVKNSLMLSRTEGGQLTALSPIFSDGKLIGVVYIQSDLSEIASRLRDYVGIALIVLAISLAIAFAVSSRMEKKISGPILSLAETSRSITSRKDYSLRTTVESKDEIGILAEAFNEMLGEVGRRSVAIEESNRTLQHEMTERRRAEDEFRQLNVELERRVADRAAQLQAITDTANDAIISANERGEIVYFNRGAERIFGWSAGEAAGRPLTLLMPKRFYDPHRAGFQRFLSTRQPKIIGRTVELIGIHRDGKEFPVEFSIANWMTPQGTFFTAVLRDVTERKRFEQSIQEANRMKSEFLANMSHELRTPLNGIIGFSEFLVDEKPGKLNDRQREYLNDILNSGRHLLQLINDVLDLSKVEAGKMELFPETFSLRNAVEEVCSVVSPMAKKKNIAIEQTISSAVERVTLDQQKFKQVMFNLLSNAVKFTDDGGRVAIVAGPHGSNQLRLQVRDTGIGIRPEDFGKLFVEFKQIDSGTTRKYEGTGLGLALTKKIVEFQNGSITVESEPGKGSTFTVVLPRTIGAGRASAVGVAT